MMSFYALPILSAFTFLSLNISLALTSAYECSPNEKSHTKMVMFFIHAKWKSHLFFLVN